MIKKFCLKTYMGLMALVVITMLSGCQKKGVRVKDVNGALAVCKSELTVLQSKSSASIDELVEYINLTEQMEDSIISFSMRDTAYAANQKMQDEVLNVSDSLRTEILRLAFSKPRSLSDVVFIKTNTANGAKKFIDEKSQKQADRFFAKLDNNATYKDLDKTLQEYDRILSDPNYMHIESREIFRDFLKKEDICFRSMLQFLPMVPQQKLQELTDQTARICNTFYGTGKDSFASIDEIATYMTMRYNRRILQNAEVCRDQIMNGLKINPVIARNYRWMLMQPYFTIDEISMAALSSGQQQLMLDIAQDMPELYMKLDKCPSKANNDELQFLDKISVYLLKTHIKNII
jgi:hypothetical protein